MRHYLGVVVLALALTATARAQQPDTTRRATLVDAAVKGKADGQSVAPRSSGWFFAGLFAGPIGVGASALLAGGDAPEPEPARLAPFRAAGDPVALEYRRAFQDEYRRAERRHAVTGSLFGAVVLGLALTVAYR